MGHNIQEPLKDLTILYVEDEESIRKVVDEMLEKDFKTVYHAGNGKKGLEIFKEKHPDIVITDINMPVMDGFEMTKRILELEENIPIIFTTANDDKDFKPLDFNSSLYFFKPLDISRLMNALKEIGQNILNARQNKQTFQEQIG